MVKDEVYIDDTGVRSLLSKVGHGMEWYHHNITDRTDAIMTRMLLEEKTREKKRNTIARWITGDHTPSMKSNHPPVPNHGRPCATAVSSRSRFLSLCAL